MFLIKAAKDAASHLEGEIGHPPEYFAYTFVDMWKQTLVIRI